MSAVLRKVEPSRHLYEGHEYVNKDNTDIRKTFAKWRAEALKAETAESYQASVLAEHNSMNIRSFKR